VLGTLATAEKNCFQESFKEVSGGKGGGREEKGEVRNKG